MPIQITWYNEEENIQLIKFDGKWELVDYIKMYDESRAITSKITYPYVIIADFTTSTSIPAKLLSAGDKMKEPEGTNLPLITVMVGMGRLYEMMLNLITRVYPTAVNNAKLVSTWEEGLALAHDTLAKANPSGYRD
jgi:hypothetical protein